MSYKTTVLIAIAIIVGLLMILATLSYEGVRLPFSRTKPNCLIFHDGTVSVELSYPPDIIVDESFSEGVRLYRIGEREKHSDGSAMFVLGLDEEWRTYETTDALISDSLSQTHGPRFNKKATFNGIEAVLATPSPSYYYYEIPFGNRVINLDYITATLSPEERKETDKMLSSIRFTQVHDDVKIAQVDGCRENLISALLGE
jgi:hypothetical protein